MAITVKWYGLGLLAVVKNDIDLEVATSKLALATSSYTPDLDAHDFFNDVTNELAATNGYTAGGVTLTSPTYSYDAASNRVRLDVADPTFPFTAAKTWRYGIVWVDTAGASSTDPLVALLDWGSDQTVSTSYTLTIDPTGLLYLDTT